MTSHHFDAIAFVEDFSPRELQLLFPRAQGTTFEVRQELGGGELFAFAFGAVVFRDVPKELRETELARLRGALPGLKAEVVREDFLVQEEQDAAIGLRDGLLRVDRLTPGRSGVVALTVAQSAAMEYYEGIVEHASAGLGVWVDHLERRGTITIRTRALHRFIAEAIRTRTEVLGVLHLLDRPDAVWDDPGLGRIYSDLRAEFDLGERYAALEAKLEALKDSLVLILDVARDRRLLLLEVAIVLLFLLEIVLGLLRLV
jgi:uncharacterized Rmd1/YagE family protein